MGAEVSERPPGLGEVGMLPILTVALGARRYFSPSSARACKSSKKSRIIRRSTMRVASKEAKRPRSRWPKLAHVAAEHLREVVSEPASCLNRAIRARLDEGSARARGPTAPSSGHQVHWHVAKAPDR